MALDSPLFDRIRVRPRKGTGSGALGADAVHASGEPTCQHAGCTLPGPHRAPKGRAHEGEFWHFCLDHVRAYNASYNYFAGMQDTDVLAYQKDATIGHRPTWTMGVNPATQRRQGSGPSAGAGFAHQPGVQDPFGMFRDRPQAAAPKPEERRLKILERKALDTLDLPEAATGEEIKTRYKLLVKRLHPDANGGDRSSEDKLRGIIQAYKTLRTAGLC